jgi:hypothetical protein
MVVEMISVIMIIDELWDYVHNECYMLMYPAGIFITFPRWRPVPRGSSSFSHFPHCLLLII